MNQPVTLPQAKVDQEFFEACYSGELNKVKYLLTSPELKAEGLPFADIHASNSLGLVTVLEQRTAMRLSTRRWVALKR